MLTLACVLWRGSFRGRNYTHEHVRCLQRMCRRWLPVPFHFVCLTNQPDPSADYGQVPLRFPKLLAGWWSKLELFGNLSLGNGRILFLDLDSIICGDLTPLAEAKAPLVFASPLGTPSTNPRITRGVVTRFQSSVISFDSSIRLPPEVFTDEVVSLRQRYRGDQDFLGVHFKDVGSTFPRQWFMKLKDCWRNGPPPEVKVVFGHPKPLYNRRMEKAWIRELVQ